MKLGICLLIMVGLLAGLHRAAAQGFALSSSPVVGSAPYSVTAADVNGDGKLDLICANYNSKTLTVLTNNGGGTFGSNATYNVSTNPTCVLAADINGDGKVDLISADVGNYTVEVLTNNGFGIFGSNATYSIGGNPSSFFPASLCATDINGDGKVDLINTYSGGSSLTVLTNNGSGGFVSSGTYSVGNRPFSVTAADVNGDGKVDLISANNGGNTLTVLTNNGSGGFVISGTYSVGGGPSSVCAADINGDGKLDLISANNGNGGFGGGTTLTVLTNNGSGDFGSNATYTVGSSPSCVVAADINGDGRLDLICAGTSSSTLTVLTNDGSGGFVTAFTPAAGSGSYSVTEADINGDGKMDLICVDSELNFNGNTVFVLTNTLTFSPPTSTPPLTIKQSGNNLRVSWPSASAGWSLQQSPDLTTHWGPSGYSGYPISDDSTNKSLFIPSQPGNLFFRLLHP